MSSVFIVSERGGGGSSVVDIILNIIDSFFLDVGYALRTTNNNNNNHYRFRCFDRGDARAVHNALWLYSEGYIL